MESIKGYHFIEKKVQNLIRKVYVGKLDDDSSQLYIVESIFSQDVPQCYLQMIKEGPRDFGKDCILMEQVFAHPNAEEKAIVFVERQSPSPNLNDLLLKDKLSLRQRLTCILQILNAIPIVFRLGLLHDFSLRNMTFDEGKVMLFNFVKRDRSIRSTAKEVEANVKKMISQMITILERLEIDSIDLQIENQNTTRFKVVTERAGIKTAIDFKLKGEEIQLSYTNSFKNQVYREHSRKIMPEELKQCWYYFVPLEAEKLIDKIEIYQSLKSQMQPQLQVGNNAKNLKFHDENSGKYPQCLIGILIITTLNQNGKEQKSIGTAALISKNLLITCAHNFLRFNYHQQNETKRKQFFEVKDMGNIKFRLDNDDYAVEAFRIPDQYRRSIERQKQYSQDPNMRKQTIQEEQLQNRKFDYALIKLSGQINKPAYIEVVQNYKKNELKLEIKGFYCTQTENQIKSRVVQSKLFQYKNNKIQYIPTNLPTEKGFSGGPIFVNLGYQDAHDIYYFFMIGIHNGKQGQKSVAIPFTAETTAKYAKWEYQLNGSIHVFSTILDFEKVVNLEHQCEQFKSRIQEIKFNSDEVKYFSQIYKKVGSKRRTDEHITKLFFGPKMINMETMQELEAQQILLNMECFTELERYNNVIFMYHIRQYQNWMTEYARYLNEDGIFIFFIYISNRVLYFFERAKVHQQITKQYSKFLHDYRQAKYVSFFNDSISNSKIQEKILKLFQKAPALITKMALNENFKKILLLEIDYMISMRKEFSTLKPNKNQGKNIKLYQISRLSVYAYIAKQIFTKIAQVDTDIRHYFQPINDILKILMKKLLTISKSDMKRVKYTFAWTLRKWIKQSSVKTQLSINDPQNQSDRSIYSQEDQAYLVAYLDEKMMNHLEHCMDLCHQ